MATQNLTIMFTDIKGFTERTSGTTRAGMKSILAEHDRLLVPVFQYFEGRIVKTIGDAFLVVFGSPTDAVLCGVTIQEVLRQHNLAADETQRLDVRVAINVGEVELKDNDVLGEPVNIAARLEGVTEAGEVYFTDAVYQTMNRSEAPSADVGEKVFKGIPMPVKVFRVLNEPGSDLATRLANGVRLSDRGPVLVGIRDTIRQRRAKRKVLLVAAVVVVVLVGGALWEFLPTAAERALQQAETELAVGQAVSALEAADAGLRDAPADAALQALASTAANTYLDQLEAKGEYAAAATWLEQMLAERPYLQPLRPRATALEARVAAASALNDPKFANQYYPKPLKDFLARHPQDPQAAWAAARAMAEGGDAMSLVWLQREALDRGLAPNEEIFAFNISVQEGRRIDWQLLDDSRALLLKYFPDQTVAWAGKAVEGTGVMAFMTGWRVLEDNADARIEDAYFKSLRALIGASETEIVSASIAVFAAEPDPLRRTQVLAFIDELVASFPRYLNYGAVRDALAASRETLQQQWANPSD